MRTRDSLSTTASGRLSVQAVSTIKKKIFLKNRHRIEAKNPKLCIKKLPFGRWFFAVDVEQRL